ncbi:hypothetical protein T06_2089 [Trichinella sp. T6]|nr:hypothetical protein T06_2089 [Trichinella sp. T6]
MKQNVALRTLNTYQFTGLVRPVKVSRAADRTVPRPTPTRGPNHRAIRPGGGGSWTQSRRKRTLSRGAFRLGKNLKRGVSGDPAAGIDVPYR